MWPPVNFTASGQVITRSATWCAEDRDLGLGLKAVWYGAEQFGNVVGLRNKRKRAEPSRERTEVREHVPELA